MILTNQTAVFSVRSTSGVDWSFHESVAQAERFKVYDTDKVITWKPGMITYGALTQRTSVGEDVQDIPTTWG